MYRLARLSIRAQPLAPVTNRSFSVQIARMSDNSSLDANKGSVGSAFEADGKVGEKAQQVGGPFDKEGAVGKQFKSDGAVGGTAQSAAEQLQGDKKPIFDKEGAIGKQFTAEGSLGSVGEAIGGPLAKDGAIGKQFTSEGSIGGTVQENLGSGK